MATIQKNDLRQNQESPRRSDRSKTGRAIATVICLLAAAALAAIVGNSVCGGVMKAGEGDTGYRFP